MPRRTFQPHAKSTKRSQGFRIRNARSKMGKRLNVLKRRRDKNRQQLTRV